jgi:hypothetical protein
VLYEVTQGFVTPGTEHLASRVMCTRHLDIHQRELRWHSDPRGYEAAKAAWAALVAEERNRRERPAVEDKRGAQKDDPKLVDAAVQRLMGEVKRLEVANPDPRSPAWIGRDLEVEGWDRKLLRKALAQAVEDGDLVLEEYRDERRNLRRAVRPAPTGVAVKIFG